MKSLQADLSDLLVADLPVSAIRVSVMGSQRLSPAALELTTRTWRSAVERRPDLYDGVLCRLVNRRFEATRGLLVLERTSYSAYLASRAPDAVEQGFDQRADPLGLTVLVQARDGRILASRRSSFAEQNPHGLYFVGGYMEPPERDGEVAFPEEVAREVREEIGLELSPSSIRMLGLGYDPSFCYPEAFFLAKTDLEPDQVVEAASNARDAFEVGKLFWLDPREMFAAIRGTPGGDTWSFRAGTTLLQACGSHSEGIG